MRLNDWEDRLTSVVAKHTDAPFQWGSSDCFALPMDMVKAMTGKDPWAKARKYKSEKGAARMLAKYSFKNVGEAFAAVLQEIPPAFAGRGDIGVIKNNGAICGVVVLGHELAGKSPEGLLRFSRDRLSRAFRVE